MIFSRREFQSLVHTFTIPKRLSNLPSQIFVAKSERARRAQSQQNMRAREQNREPRAGGLALKKGLVILSPTAERFMM